jgi:chitosanase
MITPRQKSKIERVINVFETGVPEGKYGALAKFKDYRDPETNANIIQITYGRSQTTEFGNLKSLLKHYIDDNGIYADKFSSYISKIGIKPSLCNDQVFCDTLKIAGNSDPVMKTCQDEFFDSYYYLPALGWFKQMGFTLPLSLLVIYDSFIHSGTILPFLRQRFPEKPPVMGGDEKTWILQYVDARHKWLSTHPNSVLRKTVYRTLCLKKQIINNNWNLTQPVMVQGQVID